MDTAKSKYLAKFYRRSRNTRHPCPCIILILWQVYIPSHTKQIFATPMLSPKTLVLALATSVLALDTKLFIRLAGGSQSLGSLSYDAATQEAEFAINEALGPVPDSVYCISNSEYGPCVAYKRLAAPLNEVLVIHLDADHNIDQLSLVGSGAASEANTVVTLMKGPNSGAQPILKSSAVNPEIGNEGQPVPEGDLKKQEKSFIQQNWMYIVPPLVILFMMLPQEEEVKR
ncbi:hypothetical protein BABINDRAFT_159799 [Babjeviella inositovora NRRL Y-12698]|uniref:ER membrane protein complex subunit 10 n=1 Tax=Babjeviella inositovora NRRL Y-12698 TaxID=984486 RepID=A0A1E3QV22_9ASCO|nr:uncharacterized protein BABINDRAFT_159799 [Babjeviella inositovora NRRL Y-12698]ODQ81518.1 hypothetical protein BABINDRAFT_159799 [Babjeviella inositovora NRRL Y-12698]